MLNLVPLAGSNRKMTDCNGKASFICQLLKLGFPQPNSGAITSSRISSDKELCGTGISVLPLHGPPSANGLDGKSSCVMVNTDTHPPRIVGQIVDTIRGHLSSFGREIMDIHCLWAALGIPFPPIVLEFSKKFLFLCVHRDGGVSFSALR